MQLSCLYITQARKVEVWRRPFRRFKRKACARRKRCTCYGYGEIVTACASALFSLSLCSPSFLSCQLNHASRKGRDRVSAGRFGASSSPAEITKRYNARVVKRMDDDISAPGNTTMATRAFSAVASQACVQLLQFAGSCCFASMRAPVGVCR